MCGIFGVIPNEIIADKRIMEVVKHSEQRGVDSSGYLVYDTSWTLNRAERKIRDLITWNDVKGKKFLFGHSRLITNGMQDNQPLVKDRFVLIHNGIIVNDSDLWEEIKTSKELEIDSEVILGIAIDQPSDYSLEQIAKEIIARCYGTMSCALLDTVKGELVLFSNNGSLYVGNKNGDTYFASEKFALTNISCDNIEQIYEPLVLSTEANNRIDVNDFRNDRNSFIPSLGSSLKEEALLEYDLNSELKRCTKCILPATMPFISFDTEGVCNYCNNYELRNTPKPFTDLEDLVRPYRRKNQPDCLVPFSGGRDSSYGLHLIVKELGMNPITYTYDWGMVTDLGRRNISRMSSKLGVENIIVAANIQEKRKNIRKNLRAWLKSPDLGMISILTAGDKHFFRYIEDIKRQTGISLNLWGVNPLEITHFKSGFLGVAPDFHEKMVYSNGILKQLNYHKHRFKAMSQSPGYFNASLWDTLSGEYYRSFKKKRRLLSFIRFLEVG